MDIRRQQEIARLMRKGMGEIFRPLTQQLRGVLVSVILVRVTPNLSRVRIYPGIFPPEHADEPPKYIQDNAGSCCYGLSQCTGQRLRIIPEMEYHIDDSLDYLERIDRLLKQ